MIKKVIEKKIMVSCNTNYQVTYIHQLFQHFNHQCQDNRSISTLFDNEHLFFWNTYFLADYIKPNLIICCRNFQNKILRKKPCDLLYI